MFEEGRNQEMDSEHHHDKLNLLVIESGDVDYSLPNEVYSWVLPQDF